MSSQIFYCFSFSLSHSPPPPPPPPPLFPPSLSLLPKAGVDVFCLSSVLLEGNGFTSSRLTADLSVTCFSHNLNNDTVDMTSQLKTNRSD